jgi:hypothetical protein
MKLFGDKSQTVVVDGLITDAAPPPQASLSHHWGDWVWAVADLGSGPNLIRSVVEIPTDRWLVPGMRVQMTVHLDKLDHVKPFSVDFDQIPTIEERVAANDPVLADPRAARNAAFAARDAATQPVKGRPAGVLPTVFSNPLVGQAATSSFSPRPHLDTRDWSDSFDQALAALPGATAPQGETRALAIPVAMRISMSSTSHNWDGTPAMNADGRPQHPLHGNQTVLAINVPGRAPYAVFDKHFKSPRDKPMYLNPSLYPFLPARVSDSDPNRVEIVWDEVATEEQTLSTKISETVESRLDMVSQIQAGGVPEGLPDNVQEMLRKIQENL